MIKLVEFQAIPNKVIYNYVSFINLIIDISQNVSCRSEDYQLEVNLESRMAQQLYIEYKSIFCIQVYG